MKIYKKNGIFWSLIKAINYRWWHCATTLFSTVYMPEWYFVNPSGNSEYALMLHEQTHVEQWEKDGWNYILGWLFSKKNRSVYELEAYRKQITFLLKQKVYIDEIVWAESISSLYWIFNFITFEEAKEVIKKWKEESNG